MIYKFHRDPGLRLVKAVLLDGPLDLQFEDTRPDEGGYMVQESYYHTGRRIRPDTIPKAIRRFSSASSIKDYDTGHIPTVSERFREVIEAIEPGTHQFERVDFVDSKGGLITPRWFWQVCNRLDTIDRDRSKGVFKKVCWLSFERAVFKNDAIGSASFWSDKHLLFGPFMTERAKQAIDSAGMTGLSYLGYPSE